MRGDNELKRGIVRNFVTSIKNSVCKLMIIQKILSVTIPLLKRSSLNLKLKLSVILQYMLQLKTKTMTILLNKNLKLIIMAGCLAAFFWTLYWGAINEIIVWSKPFAQAFQASWYNYLGMLASVMIAFFIYSQHNSLSGILQHMLQLKTKTITRLSHALHAVYVHTTKNRKRTIITLVVSVIFILNLFFFSIISGQLFVRTNMYSYGSIQIQTAGVTAYTDASCTTIVTVVPWGSLAPGSSGTNIIYLKNEGTTSLTLSLNTTNWNPINAPNYITLNWNYNGQTIAPDQVIQITLTLSVSQNISGISSFNFEIIIDGTG